MAQQVAEMNRTEPQCSDYKRCSDVSERLQMDQCWWLTENYECECPVSNVYFNQKCPWEGLPEGSRWLDDNPNKKEEL